MIDLIAKLMVWGEKFLILVALFMLVMAIIWTFQLMRDPAKQLDLAMDLFKNIFVWTWKIILFFWMCILYVLNLIKRVFTVTFATIRDFFVSKN
tara:strand:+ start:3379 stop:3660 length:282 start_codon:yes stop_codon:yes gene_type:complete